MRNALLLTAAAAVAAALLLAPTATGSRYIKSGIFDDAQILYGNPDKVFPILQQMNTQLIRVNLWWGGPQGVARTRPTNATDPADPAYDWATYDRTVRYAQQSGVRVVFSVLGTPTWANGNRNWNVAPRSALDLKSFVRAAARRYDGRYVAADGQGLPKVSYWLAWNEPNNPLFLTPQYRRVGSRWTIQSAVEYAKICNAVVGGVRSVRSNGGRVACGVTAPRGNNNPLSVRPSISPLPFLRAMKAAGARGFKAFAHHPYYGAPRETPSTPPPPGIHGNAPTAITLGNFDLLTREVARLYGNVRLWVTEYGYQTNPPDKIFGVSWSNQADYLREAYDILARHPKVDMFLWFLLRDETRPWGWQSGLYSVGWKRKPAREVFERLRG